MITTALATVATWTERVVTLDPHVAALAFAGAVIVGLLVLIVAAGRMAA